MEKFKNEIKDMAKNLWKRGSVINFDDSGKSIAHSEVVKFIAGDRVRYIYNDDIPDLIKKGQLLTIKEVKIWALKNTISYRVEVNGEMVGLRDFEIEMVKPVA